MPLASIAQHSKPLRYPPQTPISYKIEKKFSKQYSLIGGVDEAGRGALAGPVVAAIVILHPKYIHPLIYDSKCIAPPLRETLAQYIKKHAIAYAIGKVPSYHIDQINILKATQLAIRRAYKKLSKKPQCLLIDGNRLENLGHWKRYPPRTYFPPHKEYSIIKGDQLSVSIAAASILAKVARDRWMIAYHRRHLNNQVYQFHQNKGYGVKTHLQALNTYGLSPIHRKTFAPCNTLT